MDAGNVHHVRETGREGEDDTVPESKLSARKISIDLQHEWFKRNRLSDGMFYA
jgi:hypothetical protein